MKEGAGPASLCWAHATPEEGGLSQALRSEELGLGYNRGAPAVTASESTNNGNDKWHSGASVSGTILNTRHHTLISSAQ